MKYLTSEKSEQRSNHGDPHHPPPGHQSFWRRVFRRTQEGRVLHQ